MSLSKKESPEIVEKYFVQALHVAIENDDRKVIAKVQDLLANLALQTGQLDKVNILFNFNIFVYIFLITNCSNLHSPILRLKNCFGMCYKI